MGAADVVAVIGRLLRAAHADQGGISTVGADARRGLDGGGGHGRSVSAPKGKSNGTTTANADHFEVGMYHSRAALLSLVGGRPQGDA